MQCSRASLGAMNVKINVERESEETIETEKTSDQVDESLYENMETENVETEETENMTDWADQDTPGAFRYESS